MSAVPLRGWPYGGRLTPTEIMARLGLDLSSPPSRLAAELPFSLEDATCGVENELQAVVIGDRENVDLPRTIEKSNYFQNIRKRHRRGELPRKVICDLEYWLAENHQGVWENSWVRLGVDTLSPLAADLLDNDLKRDKNDPASGPRTDVDNFLFKENGEQYLRAPVSYLLKLALVDVVGGRRTPDHIRRIGLKLADRFICDNTSPEVVSFHVVPMSPDEGMGKSVAAETARRFLLTQLLVQYAQTKFRLRESGQNVLVYFAPHPPIRQKSLNDCLSDSFYRDLFMNPCLSGWDRGEDKHRYMHLCHQVLSRSRLNALGRLKDAGIITNNLVVLPSSSNISLLNNGTHLSLGSRMLSKALADPASGFGPEHEKYFGDLVIKFVEHFLPLFVGTYSAAPYRLAFKDFHPETVLSFLPYQLDYTHLRMIWRRWRKKARLKTTPFGVRLTPFGPHWVDGLLSRLPGIKGDFVPDFRLIDYLVGVMSTDQSPALNGRIGNQDGLKQDLAQLGVFDPQMPVYLPYRSREYHQVGFSGFEGRIFSLFSSLGGDLAQAADIQCLLTALAFKLICTGRLTHSHIPDSPEVESERRQIFFASAIGLPTFFVGQGTGNLFLKNLLERVPNVRRSRRYPGFFRVKLEDYRSTAAQWMCEEAADLIECLGLEDTVRELHGRLHFPDTRSAAGRLTRGIIGNSKSSDPLEMDADEFNRAAEIYYRDKLRLNHIKESWEVFEKDLAQAASGPDFGPAVGRETLADIIDGRDPLEFAQAGLGAVLNEISSEEQIIKLIYMVLMVINQEAVKADRAMNSNWEKGERQFGDDNTSVCGQA